jgi:hypothetical protein
MTAREQAVIFNAWCELEALKAEIHGMCAHNASQVVLAHPGPMHSEAEFQDKAAQIRALGQFIL